MTEAFEDLEVWKHGTRLAADIYRGLRDLKDWDFRDQITRSFLRGTRVKIPARSPFTLHLSPFTFRL